MHLFEVTPRSSSKMYTSVDNDNGNTVDLLPIKGDAGIIRRKAERVDKEG